MSFQAMTWAIEQKVGNSTAKFLLLILANYADNVGTCWPSQQTLADDTEMSDRSIRTAIGYLVEKGLLSVTHRPGTGEGRKSNIYRLTLPEKFSECRGGNRKNLQGQPENFAGQPEKSSDKPVIEPVKEPVRLNRARKRAVSIPEGFPSEDQIRWTLKEHPKLSAWTEAEKFRDYALQHDKSYADWPAAWRTWCRNATLWSAEKNRRFG